MEFIKETHGYFNEKLTTEQICYFVSVVTYSKWVETDEGLMLMYFENTNGRKFSVNLGHETIIDIVIDLLQEKYQDGFISGKKTTLCEIRNMLGIK
jgi:hypothetical protein